MNRGIKLVGAALLLGAASLSVAACSSTGNGYANEIASCNGGYPPGSGISDTSPYSPNANPFQPDCQQLD
jgi:hypothetical protein